MSTHPRPTDQLPRSLQRGDGPVWNRLWIKLLGAFLLITALSVGLVGVLANRSTTRQFEIYVSQGRQLRAERLAPEFSTYYARTGSWEGIDAAITALLQAPDRGQGQGQGRGSGLAGATDRLVLVDGSSRVIVDTAGDLIGASLSPRELAMGATVEVNGQMVGTLIIPAAVGTHQPSENTFLQGVNRSLVWAALAAGALALVLGLLLTRHLTAPLRDLTQAAHSLAAGDLAQVTVRSGDELGNLARAFNQMAQSLAHQEILRRNLMADIAHELRTPLTVMRSDLEALLDGVFEPSSEALASLHDETLLLSRLVDDLRALAQAEAGQLELEFQETDLTQLVRNVVERFGLQAESLDQRIELKLPATLPPIMVDPQRIRQVTANLLSNALRHAAQPGSSVIVTAKQQEREIIVSVSDKGPGIPEKDLIHIFDRFWRGTQSRTSGSGLGLAIARELIRAHGGQIGVQSKPGQGATFFYSLPLDRNSTSDVDTCE